MQMCSLSTWLIGLLFAVTSLVQARDIYVDHERGDDEAAGKRPLKTIARAIRMAEPGDVIHLKATKTPYRESATFSNKSGEPGKPIVLDGHGATLCGSDPLDPAQWEKVGPGLYRSDKVIKAVPAIIGRWYFVFDGQMNLMGRTSKGPKAAFKKPEELKPGEWTYQEPNKSFYIKIDPKKKLDDCNIEAPVRSNGVGFGGDCNHIVIRNLTATHVWNDGYNIHGKTRDILFQNVTAIDCGDDGLSAHEDCEVRVDGLVSIGNSTGMCNVGHSSSTSDKVFIKGCHAYDYYMLGSNTHVLTNSIIHAGGWRSVVSAGEKDGVCTVKMDNVVIVNQTGGPRKIEIGRQSVFEAKRLTVCGLDLDFGGISVALTDSVIAGEPVPEIMVKDGTKWSANGNVYDVKNFRISETIYPPDQFGAYRSATRQDAESKYGKVKFETPVNGEIKSTKLRKGTGADVSAIPSLPEQKEKGRRRR